MHDSLPLPRTLFYLLNHDSSLKNHNLKSITILTKLLSTKYRVEEHVIECRTEVDPTIVERPNVLHVAENVINNEEMTNNHHIKVGQTMINNNIFFTYTHV